jgi:hypothetical protein
MDKIGVAIIGSGGIAKAHVKGFLALGNLCEVMALCDSYPSKAERLAQRSNLSGAEDATLVSSRVGNLYHREYLGLEDFGDACFTASNGVPCYFSLDWYTPDGLGTWGDGRMFIVGIEGYIELRKYIDVATSKEGDHVILVDGEGEKHFRVRGKVGFSDFGRLIRDCLDRSETAMKQEHTFRAIELAIEAEEKAVRIR